MHRAGTPDNQEARWALIDSPTTTQVDNDVQETPARGSRTPATAAVPQAPAPGDPVSTTIPAWGADATVVPTATHCPVLHETASRSALVGVTGVADQVDPPSAVTSTAPRPARLLPSVVAVVPTATQVTSATGDGVVVGGVELPGVELGGVAVLDVVVLVVGVPEVAVPDAAVPGVDPVVAPVLHDTPWSGPVPAGTGCNDQVTPSSIVAATTPPVWATSTGLVPVAQQSPPSVHDTSVASDTVGGSAPVETQVAAELAEVRPPAMAVTRPAMVPMAVHRPPEVQATAVTSVVPAGTSWEIHVAPRSRVVRIAPGPVPPAPAWPTATQERAFEHAIPVR